MNKSNILDSKPGVLNPDKTFTKELIFSKFGGDTSTHAGNVFRALEITAAEHVTALGFGRDELMKYNVAWILATQRIHYYRMPEYDEAVRVSTWPGKKRFSIFPRFYKIEDMSGNILVKSSSKWSLMNLDTRSIDMNKNLNIDINEVITGSELAQAKNIRIPDIAPSQKFDFKVIDKYIDKNGHMNNAVYIDIVFSAVKKAKKVCEPFCLQIQFKNELHLGENTQVELISTPEDSIYITGIHEDKASFYASIENISD